MTVSVLKRVTYGYRSGMGSVNQTLIVPPHSMIVVVAGSAYLDPEDAAWNPSITDAGRLWDTRVVARTPNPGAWMFDWYNDSYSSVSVTFDVVFPVATYNPTVGFVVLAVTDTADPAVSPPDTVKMPLLSSDAGGPSAMAATINSDAGDQTIMGFATYDTTEPVAATDNTLTTVNPESVRLHSGEGYYGAIWRTNPGVGGNVLVGASSPATSYGAVVAASYSPFVAPPPGPPIELEGGGFLLDENGANLLTEF